MSNKVRRTFSKSICTGIRRGPDGMLVEFHDELLYPANPTTATNKFRRMYRDPSIVIETVKVIQEVREMSLDMFREYSHVVAEG